MYARDRASRKDVATAEENMKALRWFTIAFAAGCLGYLAVPHGASAAVAHSIAPAPRAAKVIQNTTTTSHSATPSRRPAGRTGHPANRSKTRHSTSSWWRGHSLIALLPRVGWAVAADLRGSLHDNGAGLHGARLNRMLESRGPPRAGPAWIPVLRGFSPPSPAHLSSSASPRQPASPIQQLQSRSSCRPFSRARRQGLHMPSLGGFPS